MATNRIKIDKFRGKNSTTFTGRPQGKQARKELDLDKLDNSEDSYVIEIPTGTTSFNPSFFLGLFYDSIKKLTPEKFQNKYKIEILDEDKDLKEVLLANIEDGLRYAIGELDKKVGFHKFIHS